MEAGADFQQACHMPFDLDASFAGFGDAGQYLQQRALAGAIASDDTDDLATPDLEIDVLQRPELFLMIARAICTLAEQIGGRAMGRGYIARYHIAQSSIALALALMA